jgi:hydroxymethylpyrimidine/phosphomethylpyrimidine kinase
MPTSPPVVLSIAGSDNSAGAGIQTDLKTFSALGTYGLTAITCLVAEIPGRVSGLQAVRPKLLAEQIRLCFDAFPIAAVKTGLLYSRSLIRVVAEELRRAPRVPLVIDPVMVASSGDALLRPDAIRAYWSELFPLASLLTPNLDELNFLLGIQGKTHAHLQQAAVHLQSLTDIPILAKGGHLGGKKAHDCGPRAIDLLALAGGQVVEFSAPFFPRRETHGTGCTYSAAIAAGLARDLTLVPAIAQAKAFITQAIEHQHNWPHRRKITRALNVSPPALTPDEHLVTCRVLT